MIRALPTPRWPVIPALALWALTSLPASPLSEWSEWTPLGGNTKPERDGAIEVRQRIAELSENPARAATFLIEFRNRSDSHAARIQLLFPRWNDATQSWDPPDESRPERLKVPPLGTASLRQPSPSALRLEYASLIEWEDEAVDDGTGSPGNPADAATPEATPEADPVTPITPELAAIFSLLEQEPETSRFSVLLKLTRPAGFEEPMAHTDSGVYTWRQVYHDQFAFRAGEYPDLKLEIISESDTEFVVRYGSATVAELLRFREYFYIVLEFIELSRLSPNGTLEPLIAAQPPKPPPATRPAENGPLTEAEIAGKIVPGTERSESPARAPAAGQLTGPTLRHSGYWFDPGDRDAKAPDPVIYVRLGAQALRMPLSVAKRDLGVPADASPTSMSHYSEQRKTVLIDRGTHRAPAGK
jgi:hypothetical protein